MQLIFTIINRKGGVGKTSTVFNLAHFAAEQGLRTGVVDLDTQGSASRGLTGDSTFSTTMKVAQLTC